MPTYDYECDACGHKLEIFQGINEQALKKCPSCNKNQLRRLFGTGAAIVFKGSGFYQTDYRSDSYKKGAAADSSSTGESKSSETKSDSSSSSAPASDSSSKSSSPTGLTSKTSSPKKPKET
jgi:putative FmdB family regulatory protein